MYPSGEFIKMINLPNGSILISGEYLYESPINQDVWVINLDMDGAIIWQKTFGGLGPEYLFDMKLLNDNNIVILADTQSFGAPDHETWVLKITQSGSILWQKMIGYWFGANIGFTILEVPELGFYISGYTTSYSHVRSDAWLVFLNSNGELIWNVTYGTEGDYVPEINFQGRWAFYYRLHRWSIWMDY